MSVNVGIVGATGMVGQVFLDLLIERNFPVADLRLFASEKSEGSKVKFQNREVVCEVLKPNCFKGLDLVFFSSGDEISKQWAPHAQECGAFAIDNSAAFRMSSKHKLIVPEINGHLIPDKNSPEVIANPNCSTIQLVVALAPLARDFGINNVRVATYQSVSGSGVAGREEMVKQLLAMLDSEGNYNPKAKIETGCYPHQIAFNSLPHIGSFNNEGFCSEEVKIMNETRKILNLPNLAVSAFTVRVPSWNGHSEAVWVTLDEDVSKSQIEKSLSAAEGLVYVPQEKPESYPHVAAHDGDDPVYVGRLHKDPANKNTWIFWCVADNIRKGAALNGLQIAEKIYSQS